jgi:NADH-quinone oxidoreductase E subunit
MISEVTKERMRAAVARYPVARSAMLPVLRLAQEEEGYLTPAGIRAAAEAIGVLPDEVESVATFYSMFSLKPVGKRVIKVCTSIACYLRGCDRLMEGLERDLGIKRGETSSDGQFTLLRVECLASCGTAPVLQVNDEFEEQVTLDRARALVQDWREHPLP